MMGVKERVRAKFVGEINQAELACRIFENVSGIAASGIGRPYPTSPELSMEVVRKDDPIIHARIMAASKAAMEYLIECINKGSEPS